MNGWKSRKHSEIERRRSASVDYDIPHNSFMPHLEATDNLLKLRRDRAMERDPKNRYTSVPELAWDLHQLDRVGGTEPSEFQGRRRQRSARPKRIWSFLLTMVPLVIFTLLLAMARQR
jgi:hypothetical protein